MEPVESRILLSADLTVKDMVKGLDNLLGTIQDGLQSEVFNIKLPLIGDSFSNAADQFDQSIQDFRDNFLKDLADGGNAATKSNVDQALDDVISFQRLELAVEAQMQRQEAPRDSRLGPWNRSATAGLGKPA